MRTIAILAFLLIGCAAEETSRDDSQQTSAKLSAAFTNLCATCHGPEGRGQQIYPKIPRIDDEAAFIKKVRTGSGKMPKFDRTLISDDELKSDFAWLTSGRR